MYPVIFFDALRVKIRDEATVRSKAIYLALAVLPDGSRDILGLWIEQTEGAKFWMKVFSDLKTRGCQDILIAVTDGLKGMSDALAAVFPETTLQTCIVHLIRHSLDFANWKERKLMAVALRPIYAAPTADAAAAALEAFERGPWGLKFPMVVASWRRAWTQVIPFFAFPPEVRRLIYTTNALESVHAQLRKIIKTRGHFPTDEAATKLIWLALRNITAKWARGALHWKTAMRQFAILYEDRFLDIDRRKMRSAHGRCRSRGRTERAHRSLENRTERGFPQRPHASWMSGGQRRPNDVNRPYTRNSGQSLLARRTSRASTLERQNKALYGVSTKHPTATEQSTLQRQRKAPYGVRTLICSSPSNAPHVAGS